MNITYEIKKAPSYGYNVFVYLNGELVGFEKFTTKAKANAFAGK